MPMKQNSTLFYFVENISDESENLDKSHYQFEKDEKYQEIMELLKHTRFKINQEIIDEIIIMADNRE